MKLHPRVKTELKRLGRPWAVIPGGKHNKVLVEGKLVAVLPRGVVRDAGCGWQNTVASIRRAVR